MSPLDPNALAERFCERSLGVWDECLYLKELVEYWLHQYDWHRHEREMTAFSHYKTTLEGIPIHRKFWSSDSPREKEVPHGGTISWQGCLGDRRQLRHRPGHRPDLCPRGRQGRCTRCQWRRRRRNRAAAQRRGWRGGLCAGRCCPSRRGGGCGG